MIVCHCKGITDRELRRRYDQGTVVRTDDLYEQDPSKKVCGGCRPLVDRLLREYAASNEPPRDNDAL